MTVTLHSTFPPSLARKDRIHDSRNFVSALSIFTLCSFASQSFMVQKSCISYFFFVSVFLFIRPSNVNPPPTFFFTPPSLHLFRLMKPSGSFPQPGRPPHRCRFLADWWNIVSWLNYILFAYNLSQSMSVSSKASEPASRAAAQASRRAKE